MGLHEETGETERQKGKSRDESKQSEQKRSYRKKASLEDGWPHYSGDFSRERASEVKREGQK